MPELRFSFRDIDVGKLGFLFRKGVAFQAFPLGDALNLQGALLIVQYALGPGAVAIFGSMRTLVRSVNQITAVISQAVWPEMTHLLGARDFKRASRLYRASVGFSLLLALCATVFLLLFGHPIYTAWTRGCLTFPQGLLSIFLLAIPFNTLWMTSSIIHLSHNQHEGLAARYLAANILGVFACFVLTVRFGLYGAAISTVVVDLTIIPFTLRTAAKITGDTVAGVLTRCWPDVYVVCSNVATSSLRRIFGRAKKLSLFI
jgi:O-antigen/teichoic acid export membrane protein